MEGGSGVVYRVVGRTRSKADCGQQTERQPPTSRQDTTWKKYTDSPGVGAPPVNLVLSVLILDFQVPSAHPVMSGIQREAKK